MKIFVGFDSVLFSSRFYEHKENRHLQTGKPLELATPV